jgi:hypothetical protein
MRSAAPVVLVAAEEAVDEMHRRLHNLFAAATLRRKGAAGAQEQHQFAALLEENLRVYPLAGRARLRLDGDESAGSLSALNEAAQGARLVIIDPLRQFHSGDENDSWAMTSLVQKLQALAYRHRCAVLLTHHTSKHASMGGLGDHAGASRGSGALTDALRWQLNLSRMDASLGKSYGIPVGELDAHIRADFAKTNYMAPRPPLAFRREAGGALRPMLPKLSAGKGRGR